MNPDRQSLLTRRSLLRAAVALLCPISASCHSAHANLASSSSRSLYISGARESATQHLAVVFDDKANLVATVPLTDRAHGAASHFKSHRACIFGRRPGFFMNAFDIRSPEQHRVIKPAIGRHYYGHGAYSADGNLLYATENDFDNARGVVGIYDATRSYRRIGEFDSHGIGPHEIVRVPGSALLVVANGGIQTHPDSGREKLNIKSMQPCLSIIDSRNGKLVGQHILADQLHQVSIRHLACTSNGEIWYAAQYEGDNPRAEGLVGVVSIQASISSFQHGMSKSGLKLVHLPEIIINRAAGYLSSVAIVGQHAVFSCAKGGFVFTVDRDSHQIDDSLSILDCSGVAVLPARELHSGEAHNREESILVTSGTGDVVGVSDEGVTNIATHRLQWDNHVYPLSDT